MHELSVTENLLEITLRHAQQAGANNVLNIYLVVGQLSSIVDDSVDFYWNIVAKDTIAENAKLHFRRIPTRLKCKECNEEYLPSDNTFTCPRCNGSKPQILSGQEFYVEAIDVE
jgi:hydrogenase nickel incorporation protein HypA/HybF